MGSKITSHVAEAKNDLGDRENSINLGKFSSVKELLDAYNSLQSEFTRRSQKIKELVREIDLYKKEQSNHSYNNLSLGDNKSTSVDEKMPLQNTANCGGESQMLDGASVQSSNKNKENLVQNDFTAGRECCEKGSALTPRVKLLSGNGQASITPPLKPVSLADAGEIARQIFDK